MDESFGRPLVVSIVGFALLLAFLLTTRFRLACIEAEVADLSLRDSPVGGAVAPPRLGRDDG